MTYRIAIVGGGLGGLSAALALLRRGFDVHVYERAPELLEIGAGVHIGPNCTRILRSFGLGEHLDRIGFRPSRSVFRRWSDGEIIADHAMDDLAVAYGAPVYTVHRGELLAMLLSAFPSERVHVDHRCVAIEQDQDGVRIRFDHDRDVVADLVVGADGIHSTVRDYVVEPEKPLFSGCCAYRGLLPWEVMKQIGGEKVVGAWFGPGGHVVQYPISGGSVMNIVAMVQEPSWTRESWLDVGSKTDLLNHFAGWDPRLQDMFRAMDDASLMKWALYDRAALPTWRKGRVVLLGDAAHAMLPFMAQGAAQAIEDGVTLARSLEAFDIDEALVRYEDVRRPRATRVQDASRENNITFHSNDDSVQQKRDSQLSQRETIHYVYSYDALSAPLESALA